jgi:hypothetical protein
MSMLKPGTRVILCGSGCRLRRGPRARGRSGHSQHEGTGVSRPGGYRFQGGKGRSLGNPRVLTGDASITVAATNGGINRIHPVETTNILGIYAKYTTIVYGEQPSPGAAQGYIPGPIGRPF